MNLASIHSKSFISMRTYLTFGAGILIVIAAIGMFIQVTDSTDGARSETTPRNFGESRLNRQVPPVSHAISSEAESPDASDEEMICLSATELADQLPDLVAITEEEANELPGPEGDASE